LSLESDHGLGDINEPVFWFRHLSDITRSTFRRRWVSFHLASYIHITDSIQRIVGLAFESISFLQKPPFFLNAIAENSVKGKEFSIKLSSSGGELFLGGTDNTLYKGSIEYSAITGSTGVWQIGGGQASSNGKTIAPTVIAIIDSGTTLMYGPNSVVDAFWAQVPGSAPFPAIPGSFSYPCHTPPSLSFNFGGGSTWTVSPQK
jgi:cathepsin D